MLRQGASTSTAPLPSSLEGSTSSPALCVGRLGLNSRANSFPPQPSANTPSSHVLSAESVSFALRSKSAIFKAGVITPITPNFSPAARGHPEDHKRHTGCETKVNGKSDMQVSINRCSPLGCGTPISLDEKSPAPWQNSGIVSHAQPHKLERQTYASLSNLPTPPPSDSPLSPVLFPKVSSEDLQDPDVFGPAYYLASLIPTCASASPPCIPLLQLIVHRFGLRPEVIALAGIILDTLSSQFIRKWRTELSRLCVWDLCGCGMGEILALVALGIAVKWIEDRGVALTAGAMSDISDGRFGRKEIVATERLMLAEVGWGLMNLSSERDLKWAMEEMNKWRARVEVEQR
ncbi:hypothetical protein EV426DRAFT_707134 [Tirmania nivea]|nr:hypothetical protein EV426DRAFT_707134 [Tirmania nivea]